MSATTFGIVYATQSKMVMHIILPDSDEELKSWALSPGTSLLITPTGPNDVSTCEALVKAATGVAPLKSRHAIIDKNGVVVAVANIDPALDAQAFPGATFVQTDVAFVGCTFSPKVGFTTPASVIPAGALIRNAQGDRRPSLTDIDVPAQAISDTASVLLP